MNAIVRYELARLRPAAVLVVLVLVVTALLQLDEREPIPAVLLTALLCGAGLGAVQGALDRGTRNAPFLVHRRLDPVHLHAARALAGAAVLAVAVIAASVLLRVLPVGDLDWTMTGPTWTPARGGLDRRQFPLVAATVTLTASGAIWALIRLGVSRRRWLSFVLATTVPPTAVVFALIRLESPWSMTAMGLLVTLAATALVTLDLARLGGGDTPALRLRQALTWTLIAATFLEASLWFRPYAYWDKADLEATSLGRIRVTEFDGWNRTIWILDRDHGTWTSYPSNGVRPDDYLPGEMPIGHCDNVLGGRDAWPGTYLDPGPLRPHFLARFPGPTDRLEDWLDAIPHGMSGTMDDWSFEDGVYAWRTSPTSAPEWWFGPQGMEFNSPGTEPPRFRAAPLVRVRPVVRGRGAPNWSFWTDRTGARLFAMCPASRSPVRCEPRHAFVWDLDGSASSELDDAVVVVPAFSFFINVPSVENEPLLRTRDVLRADRDRFRVELDPDEEVLPRGLELRQSARGEFGGFLFTHVGPVYADEATVRLRVIGPDGGVSGRDEVRCTPLDAPSRVMSEIRGLVAALRPPIASTVSFLLPAPRDHVEYHARWLRSSAIAGGHMGRWLAVSWLLSGLLALWARQTARQRLADPRGVRRWTWAVLATGLVGFVTFRVLVPRAPRTTCACGARRPAARDVCPSCGGNDAPPPAPLLSIRG